MRKSDLVIMVKQLETRVVDLEKRVAEQTDGLALMRYEVTHKANAQESAINNHKNRVAVLEKRADNQYKEIIPAKGKAK